VEGSKVKLSVHKHHAHPDHVMAVRYAHSHAPECGLYNGVGGADDHEGLIALPFELQTAS